MLTEDSAQGFGRTSFPGVRPGGANFLNNLNILLLPSVLVNGAWNTLLGAYDGVYRFVHPPASGTATRDESIDLESQVVNNHQVTNIHNQNNPFTPEADDPVEVVQRAEAREHGSDETSPSRPRRTWKRIVVVILVVLVAIMVPGLILWLVTRQVAWGLACSAVVAPAATFFGGLYYHHNT